MLSNLIQTNTAKIDNWLAEHHLPTPSFDKDGPVDFGIDVPEIQQARMIVMESSLELHDLLAGPAMYLRSVVGRGPTEDPK